MKWRAINVPHSPLLSFEVLHNSCLNNNALPPSSLAIACVASKRMNTNKFRYKNVSCLLEVAGSMGKRVGVRFKGVKSTLFDKIFPYFKLSECVCVCRRE